jgi:DNA-binding CsgD family transcriptional regulator
MRHLVLGIYLLALIAGAASIMETFMIWQRYRRAAIKRYGLFLSALFLILLGFIVDLYARSAPPLPAAADIVWVFQAAGGCLFIFICPYLFHSLAGKEVVLWQKILFAVIDAVVVFGALAAIAFPRAVFLQIGLGAVLFAMIVYGVAFSIGHLSRIGERALRRALVIFLALTVVFFPLMLADAAMSFAPFLSMFQFLNNLAQPAYFLILNCLTIIFGLRYLNRPAFSEKGRLSPYFLDTFKVTDREAQIIGMLLEGSTTGRIAELLFISPKTAENHVYNIYQKLRVRNRVQLFQLIRTNALD